VDDTIKVCLVVHRRKKRHDRSCPTVTKGAKGSAKPFDARLRALGIEHGLTRIEQEVLRGFSMGISARELSEQMLVTPNAVKAIMRSMMLKMGVKSRLALAANVYAESTKQPELSQRQPESIDASTSNIELVLNKAIEVIGDRDKAMRWLGTPVPALDYATPISLLGTIEGKMRVEDVLGQVEHGVW
jgi:putative toxin-antitoxin system antitoxin component (TIGR02293 family)